MEDSVKQIIETYNPNAPFTLRPGTGRPVARAGVSLSVFVDARVQEKGGVEAIALCGEMMRDNILWSEEVVMKEILITVTCFGTSHEYA